jgi:hypothetical protein
MSRDLERLARAGELAHERARTLAAESVDTNLEPGDAEWLAGHIGACPDCAAVAEDYRVIHDELRSLSTPESPRDLWAQTSAQLDLIDAAAARRSSGMGKASRVDRLPLISTAVAVGFVVVVAAASLLVQSPILAPAPGSTHGTAVALGTTSPVRTSGAPEAPLTVVKGKSYWMAADAGLYEIKGGSTQCSAADSSCTVANGTGQTLGSVRSDSPVSAVIAPDASRAAVWTKDKVVILPLGTTSQTVALDQLTPRPTVAATPTSPAEIHGTASSSASAAAGTPNGSVPELTPAPTPTSAPTSPPTSAPAGSASTSAQPTAILSGYEIVGRDPEFSPDGSRVAFSARPADHGTGPDVFLWRSGQEQATTVTFRHADLFAGWYGQKILISEISVVPGPGGAAASASAGASAFGSTSYVFDPSAGTARKIGRPMLLPAVDPTGQYLVYWSGTVELDSASGLWGPGKGDLYFDAWTDLTLTPASLAPIATPSQSTVPAAPATPSAAVVATPPPSPEPTPASSSIETPAAEPSATASAVPSPAAGTESPVQLALPQLLPVTATSGAVHDWLVRWDGLGQHVAIWVADPGSSRIGRLSLFSIDRAAGLVHTNEPLLAADKVMSGIAFDEGHLVYTSAVDGKTYMQAVPAVPPSTVSTPVPTEPGQAPSGAAAPESPSPQPTDRSGN